MPILRLNAGPAGLVLHGSPASALSAIRTAAPGTGPVIVMIHGFKYDPDCTACSPHSTIFAHTAHPDHPGQVQWMRHMGFGTGDPNEGLAIAFGWRARGNLWRAERSARAAGQHLARVIRDIKARAPERPIHVISHSMGSEVTFEALHALPAHSVQRVVTLTGASFVSRAMVAMQTPAGRCAELINVTSRENDVFDYFYERMMTPPASADRAMGTGIALPNAVTLQLDCAQSLALLPRFGGYVAAPARRVCHWSGYTRPGALRFYARALRTPEAVPLAALKRELPDRSAPRWSRIFALPTVRLPLPTARKTAT
jgi:pimeloyl-ACP methyl ester carboxylesterase